MIIKIHRFTSTDIIIARSEAHNNNNININIMMLSE